MLHTATPYGGVNSPVGKQNGRGPHEHKRDIPELDQRAKRCRLQSRYKLVPEGPIGTSPNCQYVTTKEQKLLAKVAAGSGAEDVKGRITI